MLAPYYLPVAEADTWIELSDSLLVKQGAEEAFAFGTLKLHSNLF